MYSVNDFVVVVVDDVRVPIELNFHLVCWLLVFYQPILFVLSFHHTKYTLLHTVFFCSFASFSRVISHTLSRPIAVLLLLFVVGVT